jgi:hypothetical protein
MINMDIHKLSDIDYSAGFRAGGMTYELIESPLQTLGAAEKAKYRAGCIFVARDGFGNPDITESDIELHVFNSSHTIFTRDDSGELLAFSSSSVEHARGQPVVYLQGVAVSQKGQGQGIFSVIAPLTIAIEMRKLGISDAYMAARTQSPILFRAMVTKCGLYPQPGMPVPEDIGDIGADLARLLYDGHSDFRSSQGLVFDRRVLIQRKAYGVIRDGKEAGLCMYGANIPFCRNDPKVNSFFEENLDFSNGDAVIMVGKVNHESAVRQLEAVVEKANLLQGGQGC